MLKQPPEISRSNSTPDQKSISAQLPELVDFGEMSAQWTEQINPGQKERRAHEMKAVIFNLDALVQKGSATPLPGIPERLAVLRVQEIPFAIATNQTELIGR